jgi:hypothetical protein
MYIPLKDSFTKGFRKWSDAHQADINKEIRADEGNGKAHVDPDLDNRVLSPAERPHRPWLVPGAGTL